MSTGDWHKSTFSDGGGGHCVEVREHASGADIRDTEHRELGHLSAPAPEWTALLAAVRGQ
jgi:hypothetical protein